MKIAFRFKIGISEALAFLFVATAGAARALPGAPSLTLQPSPHFGFPRL